MKLNLILLLILLFVLGCQASGGGGGGVINHVATPTKFTLSTTLNKTYNSSQEIILTATFSQAVTVTGSPNLNLTIGAAAEEASYFSGTGTNALIFKYTVSPGDLDSDGISVAANINLNGGTLIYDIDKACPLTMTLPSFASVKVDTISPTLNSVSSPISTTYLAGQSLLFNSTFSENVVVTGSPRITVDIGGTTKYATYLSGSGSSTLVFTYLVTSSDVDADGIEISSPLGLNAGTISDYGGNSSSLTFTPPVTTSVLVAGATPLITSVTPPTNGTYNSSQNLDFTLNFNKVVNVTGSPRLSLTLGSTSRDAVYLSGSGSTAIKFRYTIVGGDVDADGIALVNSVNLNGGTIRDASLNNAFLFFGAPNLTGVKVASSLPSITTISLPSSPPVSGYDVGQNIDFTVNFSEAVIETGGTSRLKMDIGGVTKYAVYTSGSGTTSLVYRYSVVLNDEDLNGVALLSPLELNGSTLANIGSYSAILTFTPPITTSIKVDAKNPALISNTLPANGTYVAAQNFDFDVTYSEPVTVTGSPRIVIDIGGVTRYATYLSGTGTPVLRFRYTIIGADADPNGIALTPAISLNAGTIKDPAGHNADLTLVSTTTTGILVGNNPPTISSIVLPANATYKTTQNVNISAVFSENVLVTGLPRLALTLGSGTVYADYVSGSGSSTLIFRYTVAADDFDVDGILLVSPLDLNSGSVTSSSLVAADLDFALPNSSGILIDGLDPVISSVTPPIDKTYILNENLDFTINYSSSVIVTGVPSLTLTIGSSTVSANYLAGSGTTALTFRYTAVSGDLDSNGILTVSPLNLNAGTINDPFGDAASLSFILPVTSGVLVDAVIPTITSVAGPTPGSYYLGNNLEFDVVTSKSITVSGSPRIALTVGATTKYASYLSGSGTSLLKFRYTVGSGDTDSDGISVSSPMGLNSGTLKDVAGNDLSPLTFTAPNTALVNVDGNGATIISLSAPANSTYLTGNNLNFTALFSQPVTVTGAPRLALTVGASTLYADYVSGSGTSSLIFRYTVGAGQSDGDGIALTAPVDLNGGTIKDAATNAAALTFTAPNTTAVLVDGIDIVISSITPPADKTYINAENLDFIVNFNYPATASGSPRIALTVGASTRYATYQSGSGTTAHTYRYAVGINDSDANGIDSLSNIDLNGGTIQDSFGDNATVTFIGANYLNVKVDAVIPTILSVSSPSPGTYYLDENLDFDVSFSESVVITGPPALSITIGSTTRLATYLSGSSTNTIKFRYKIVNGDIDTDGIALVSPAVLNAGTIKDTAGNNSTLTYTPPNTSGVKVDTSSVEIASIVVPSGRYTTGSFLDVTVNFARAVNVTGTPLIKTTVGSQTIFANYLSGSGTSSIIFRHIVAAGEMDADGINLVSPIMLNSGTIQDTSLQNAVLTYTAPNTSAVLVDGIDLQILTVTPPADKNYLYNESIVFDVNYNYPAFVTGSPRIALTVGSSTSYAVYDSGSGTSAIRFKYIVGSTDFDSNGLDFISPLQLNSGTLQDAFADAASLVFTGGNLPNVKVDGSVPTISSLTAPANGTYDTTNVLTFTATFSENVTITGSPRIPLTIGSTTRYASYSAGSGTNSATFTYTLVASDSDMDGIAVISPLDLNAGTIVDLSGNLMTTLTFTPPVTTGVLVAGNVPDVANSSITGTGPVVANGTSTSTITITLKNSANNGVVGITPTFSATNTGTTNVNSTCSATDASGVSICTLKSTKAELKTLSIVTPISKTDGTVLFTAGSAVAANSTITGTGPIVADGVEASKVTITLKDINNNLVTGTVPTFSATNTGTTNVMTACSSSDTSGISTCTLKSTKAESKILSIATPFIKAGGTVVFNPGFPAVANSNISGTTPVSADGFSSSFIEIELRDAFNNPVPGYIPIYNATNTSSGNIYGACSSTNASGISACTLASNVAELKVLQLTSPIAVAGSTVEFSSTLPTSQNSTITGSGPVIADGVATSTVTITLRDSSNNLVTLANGALPDFTATDTGVTNIYSECSAGTPGVYNCTFTSKKAETKTLSITSPVNKNDGTVIFNPGPAAIAFSTIAGTSPVVADNVALSTITVTIKDQFNNPISGSTPTFSATNTGATNTQTACSLTNATGVSTCTLKSTKAETKTLQILTPVAKTGENVVFIGGTPVAANSTITGTGPVNPDGTSTSAITITLKDIFNNLSPGVTPTFTATGSNNTYAACSVSSATGISTCTMSSTTGELKTLSIATPFVKAGGTVLFQTGSPVAANSTITGTATPVVANGTSTSTITITLRDVSSAPIAGLVPTFSATGTPNTYGICSATSLNGESTCTLSSTVAGIKTLSIESPVLKADGTVTFIAGPAVVANSTILAATPTIADGVDTCEVTVTLKDINNNLVSGIVPTYSMTGTLNTPSACPATDALGQAICTVTSTKAESKIVSLVSPFAKAGNAVEFNTVGINIQVPIELVDRGLLSSTAAVTFNRTRTSFNPLDYESQLNDYYFEVVAQNINTTSSYNVSLVNSAGTAISSSVISIPANTSALTRFRVAWTPSLSADNYRVKINATAVAGQVKVHSAKIIVHQTAATATKIYIPLAGGNINEDSGTDTTTAAIASATGSNAYQALGTATANTTKTGTAYLWNKVSTNYDAISTAADAFTLETVTSTSKASTTATVGLFNKTTGLVVTGAETALAGLTVGMTQKTFANNATNFTDTNAFEIRLKTSQGAQTAYLYKAGLWVKLKYLRKAEIYFRLATRRYVPTSPSSLQVPDGRFLWEPSEWTNPSVFFEANGQNPTTSASTISLQDNWASDSATAATTVTGSTLSPPTTYGRTRSGALSLGNLSQHTILHSATSGTPYMGGAFIVIQATE